MNSPTDAYTYRVTWSEEDAEFVGLSTEFPGLSWLAKSQTAALKRIRTIVAATVADMIKNGEPIPEPLSTKSFSGRCMVRVPPEMHRRLATEAAEAAVSLNRLMSSKLS